MPPKKVQLYNPLIDDFSITYDINEDGIPVKFTLHGHEIESFDPPIADHIKKHLANRIVNLRGIKGNYEDSFKAVLKELEVNE